ncbi:MAG: hypothetical protein WCW16_05570 [Candidatus Magasanikbacteria bacterium]
MKKIIYIFSVIFFASIGFLITSNQVDAETEVKGIISEDTVWGLDGSPYIITGNILVNSGVNLTIEPGVIVKFRKHLVMGQGLYMKIDGTLTARGTQSNKIKFTAEDPTLNAEFSWGSISFTRQSQSWSSSNNTGSIIEYSIIEYGSNDSYAENEGKGAISVNNSSPMIRNNIIRNINGSSRDALSISGGNSQIIGNSITEGRIIIFSGSPYFQSNKFTGEEFYIVEGSPTLTKNDIINTNAGGSLSGGIRIDHNSCPTITYNNIIDNANNGIIFINFKPDSGCSLTINHNNIYNNKEFATLLYDTNSNINLSDNYWGTANEADIDNLIYDKNDDFSLGEVNFKPFLGQAEANVLSKITKPKDTTHEPQTETKNTYNQPEENNPNETENMNTVEENNKEEMDKNGNFTTGKTESDVEKSIIENNTQSTEDEKEQKIEDNIENEQKEIIINENPTSTAAKEEERSWIQKFFLWLANLLNKLKRK